MAGSSGNILYYFTLSMTVLYLVLGIVVMLSDSVEAWLPGNKKYFLGVFLILYAFYRAYRIMKLNKQMHSQD